MATVAIETTTMRIEGSTGGPVVTATMHAAPVTDTGHRAVEMRTAETRLLTLAAPPPPPTTIGRRDTRRATTRSGAHARPRQRGSGSATGTGLPTTATLRMPAIGARRESRAEGAALWP